MDGAKSRLLIILRALALCALLTLPFGNPAAAYKTKPLTGTHEAITLLAQKCLRDAGEQPPVKCSASYEDLRRETKRASATYDDVQKSTRWSDDPTRQVFSAGILKYVISMEAYCGRAAERNPPLDVVGMLCSSHYGRLQFWHAMKATAQEDPELTRAKILDWADLTFKIATRHRDVNVAENYCTFFDSQRSVIAGEFELADRGLCESDPGRKNAYRVATLFSWNCGHPFGSGRCREIKGFGSELLAERSAMGALLHVIQDSYSQSHAARGPVQTPFEARIDCRLPTTFYHYGSQGSKRHKPADKLPEFDKSCTGQEEADSVVTATAMALYHLRQRSDPVEFNCYLQARVFGRRAALPGEAPPPACEAAGGS